MAGLSKREITRLRKQAVVMRSDLNRQMLAAELRQVRTSLSWLPTAAGATKLAAPLLALLAPLMLRRRPRRISFRRILSGGLLGWRAFRKLQPLWQRISRHPEVGT